MTLLRRWWCRLAHRLADAYSADCGAGVYEARCGRCHRVLVRWDWRRFVERWLADEVNK